MTNHKKNKITYEKLETSKPNYYTSMEVLEGRRNYNIQNSLVTENNFPRYFYQSKNHEGDWVGSIYTDRLDKKTKERLKDNDFYLDKINYTNIIEIAKTIFNRKDITGARYIEYTNMSNGFPLFRLDAIAKSIDTPQDDTPWENPCCNYTNNYVYMEYTI